MRPAVLRSDRVFSPERTQLKDEVPLNRNQTLGRRRHRRWEQRGHCCTRHHHHWARSSRTRSCLVGHKGWHVSVPGSHPGQHCSVFGYRLHIQRRRHHHRQRRRHKRSCRPRNLLRHHWTPASGRNYCEGMLRRDISMTIQLSTHYPGLLLLPPPWLPCCCAWSITVSQLRLSRAHIAAVLS